MWTPYSIRNIGLAAAIVALSAASAARADDISATRVVSIHGLNLTSSGGQAKLRQQIRKAAREVCAEVAHRLNPGDDDFQDCVQETFEDAWGQAETKIASAKSQALVASVTQK